MRVWLVQTWEPNLLDPPGSRLWRNGILARRLHAEGHEVVWWCSNFAHNFKRFRMDKPGSVEVAPGYRMEVLEALGYSRHVSLQRLKDHRHVAADFLQRAMHADAPDIIVAQYPPIEINEAVAKVARSRNIPLMMDVCDQYPDLYWENAPKWAKAAMRAGCQLVGQQAMTHRALSAANAIAANGPEVVDWALRYAGRARGKFDLDVPITYEQVETTESERAAAERYWESLGIPSDHLVCIYTGMLGQTIEPEPIFEAAKLLQSEPITFLLCGGGDRLEELKTRSAPTPNLILIGWLRAPELQVLQAKAGIGLMPYRPRANFERGVTNKPVEYLANGLPILTTLARGPVLETIQSYDCGAHYEAGSGVDLADKISAFQEDRERLSSAKRSARRAFEEIFHPDVVYRKWIDRIEEVSKSQIGERPPANAVIASQLNEERPLTIWLVQTWEPNVLDEEDARPFRTRMLADKLTERGHHVVWWTSNFSHYTKLFRRPTPGPVEVDDLLSFEVLDARGYKGHTSLQRLKDHAHVARDFARRAETASKPDIIVASFPPIEICDEVAKFASRHKVPLLIDIRDQYPDLYWEMSAPLIRTAVRSACHLTGHVRKARACLSQATAITANGEGALEWALLGANRPRKPIDRVIHMTYPDPKDHKDLDFTTWLKSVGIEKEDVIAIYCGAIGNTFDWESVVGAAKLLKDCPQFKIAVCGSGPNELVLRKAASETKNLLVLGWLEKDHLRALQSRASMSLAPYRATSNFVRGIPNKPVESLAWGLPLITSISGGELSEWIEGFQAGITFRAGDFQALAMAIRNLLNDPENRERMARNARTLYEEHLHPEGINEAWVSLIEEIAGDRAPKKGQDPRIPQPTRL